MSINPCFRNSLSFALLVLAACEGAESPPGTRSSTSGVGLGSPLSFPLGVETSCSATLMQLTPNLQATTGLEREDSPTTVTLTSNNGTVTATFSGITPAIGSVQFQPISGAMASVVSGQTLNVPIATTVPTAQPVTSAVPVEGGSISFDGDSFFLSLEMPLQEANGPGSLALSFECAAAGTALADCTCPQDDSSCACSSSAAPPLGAYTNCSADVSGAGPGGGGLSGGDTTVTLAEKNGALTMTLTGGSPFGTGTFTLTPTGPSTATVPSGQSFGQASPDEASCTPGGDLWVAPLFPTSLTSGSLMADGKWLTASLVGTGPCSSEERLAIMCSPSSP